MLAKKTSKNQITLPQAIAKNFPETVYFDVALEENQIVLRPVKISLADSALEKARLKIKRLGLTERDVEEAIAWARKSAR